MIMKRIVVAAAALLTMTVPARGQSARKLDLSFSSGRVSLVAENVSLQDILAEWSRKGGSRIVNAERLPVAPVMLFFENQPEADVLRALLRDAPGYGAAMRTEPPAGGSTVQTVFILAVRTTTATAGPSNTVSQPQPQVNTPQAAPRMIQGTPDDEIPPVRPLVGEQPPTTPGAPGGAAQPANPNLRMGPGGTVTSTVPGVIIPGPTPAPGTPVKPPVGRGGGGGVTPK